VEAGASDDQGERDELTGGEGATEYESPDRVAAGPLEEKATDSVEYEIGGEDATRCRAPPVVGSQQEVKTDVEE
jgi:hypothetical protein